MQGCLHDLSNQLTGIVGYAEIGRSAVPADSAARRYFGHIASAAGLACEIAGKMRGLASAEPLDFAAERCALNPIIASEATAIADLRAWCVVTTQLEPALPVARIAALDFRRMLLNLAGNAADAMHGLDRPAHLAISSSLVSPDFIAVEVSDCGRGMSEATRVRLLRCESLTTKGDGHGSGLSRIVWPTLIRCGGRLEISTLLGHGSTFTLLLPAGTSAA